MVQTAIPTPDATLQHAMRRAAAQAHTIQSTPTANPASAAWAAARWTVCAAIERESQRPRGPRAATLAALAHAYEHALSLVAEPDHDAPDGVALRAGRRHQRRASGAYATPSGLTARLLDWSLDPLIARITAGLSRNDAADALLRIRICDPACGAGAMLLDAGARLAHHLARLRTRASPGPAHHRRALADVARHCLFGVDIDPVAAALCRARLHAAAGPGAPPPAPHAHVLWADALQLDWHAAFPAVFSHAGFDLVLANPPFISAIDGGLDPQRRVQLRHRFHAVKGLADLAYYFLDLACSLVRPPPADPSGAVAMVLPRAVLSAEGARTVRESLPPHLQPRMIGLPARPDLFDGAAVHVCLLVLASATPGNDTCAVAGQLDLPPAAWTRTTITPDNWWRAASAALRAPIVSDTGTPPRAQPGPAKARATAHATIEPHPVAGPRSSPGTRRVGDVFEVRSSMFIADAYALREHLRDEPLPRALRLLTTGLIDPHVSRWGSVPCRYLGRTYRHPTITPDATALPSLARRLALARRPKVVVAGLASRLEAVLDPRGEYLASVGTYSIFAPADDLALLARLADLLNAPPASAALVDHLGANALAGGNISVKRDFLCNLVWDAPSS